MSTIEIFEPALCCNTGVCGDDVDQALVTFSADLDWIRSQGGDIAQFNLASEPLAFAEREPVKAFLQVSGSEGLPLVLVDGVTAQTGRYPDRTQLAKWAGLTEAPATVAPAGIQMLGLTDTTDAGSCCAPTDNTGTSCC
ncbi:arsenite efflux transporter metallochaperone ArsD [Rhodococcus opacus]|uniref:Arsenic resistance operon repressor n=1 Tax=Rhodococcus opacus TaxID=37919 RepID=A0A076F0S2_RHOOP|nr:arsenite efflux transporter metallochaperone ArsD [Rhodococcus opacus]AII11253.1 arsenic resistance operon repressor [Rhodococcus opacus]